MGVYIYTRQSEVITAVDSVSGIQVLINVYKYATKPYWEIWTYGAPFGDVHAKRIEALYNRIRRTALQRFDTLKANGKLSNLVVVGDFRKQPVVDVYQESQPQPLMVDDSWFGIEGKRVGTLEKKGRKWVVVIDGERPQVVNGR